ncbi:unnamed protein product [Trichobilharzia szidati]|nr:unnamed protein product [Trichobilharzia szidati]
MTGPYRVESIQLTDYLKNLENACESPNFGYTHQGLEDEMERQQRIEGSSNWIRGSVTSTNHDILNQISYITERVQTNKDCLHYLAGITSMEDIYSDVSAFNAKRALRLIMENPDNKFWRKKLSGSVNRCWQNLGKYSELATIHLKNAADFHQFYYDARHLEVKLNDRHKRFLHNRSRFAEMNHEFYTNSSKELRDWLRSQFDHLNYMVNRSKQLIEQSKSLVPIYLRTNRIKSPVNAIMLCDYETPKFKFTAGERIILIDNMAGGIDGKKKFILRTTQKDDEFTVSGESTNITSDAIDTTETDIESGSRTEEIDDRSSDSNTYNYLRYTSPRISTMPYWNFGHGQHIGSTEESSTEQTTTTTYTENVSPLGQSSSKLQWHIRSLDGKTEALVPSVCVWIPSPDMEAQEKAIKLYKVILDNWNYIIDEQLKICLEFFTVLLQRFLESDGLTTDDDEAFKRFLNNLVFSLTEPPTAEAENFNKEFLRLIDETREHWNRTKTFGTRMPGGIHLRRTEIAVFQSLLDWNKAHMRTIKQYEQENIIPVDLTQKLNDLQEQSFHMMETVSLVNDLALKDKKKLDSLLNQLRIWNKQTKDKNQFNLYPLSSSSDDEWLSSSGSEYLNSESTYESVDEIETSYILQQSKYAATKPHFTTSLRFPQKTFILPSIFTYDEDLASSCTTSEEIQSIGGTTTPTTVSSSSCTTDDEIEDYQKYHHTKQDFYHTQPPEDILDDGKNYVTTLNKQILLTLEPPVGGKDKPMIYKSRKYIDTKDGGGYSVVYIEVAPTEETTILDQTDEDLPLSKISKSIQVDDLSKRTRFTRRTWIEEQHVEEAKSLKKIEESARIIHTKPGKIETKDDSVQVSPIIHNIECSTEDYLLSSYALSITTRQQNIEKDSKAIQTAEHSDDFIYAVQQFAHVKEITEEEFNRIIQQEAIKLKSKNKENQSSQTHDITYKEMKYEQIVKETSDEAIKLKGDFGSQYKITPKLTDRHEYYVKPTNAKSTMTEIDKMDDKLHAQKQPPVREYEKHKQEKAAVIEDIGMYIVKQQHETPEIHKQDKIKSKINYVEEIAMYQSDMYKQDREKQIEIKTTQEKGFICSVLMVTIPHRVKNPPVNFIILFVMIISLSYSIALDFVDISFKWIILRWTLSVTVCLCFIFVGVIIKRDLTVFIFPLLIYLLSAILLASITISVLYILTNKYILYVSFCIFEFVTVIPCLMVAGQMLSSKRDVHFTDDDYTTAAMIYFLLILQAVTSTVGPFQTDTTKSNETSLLSSISWFETTD